MRRLRILLLFVLLLLPSGGAVYAQSATDIAEPETTRQEAAATISEKKEAPAQKEADTKINQKEPAITAVEPSAVESSAKEKSASEGSEKAEEIQAAETEKEEPAKEDSKNEADVAKEEPKEIKKEDTASKSNSEKRGEEEKGKAEAAGNNETKVLKQGTVLNPQMLSDPAPKNDGEIKYNEVMVGSFEELKQKLKEAKNNPTKIIITKGFEITETLTIEKDQNIVLTSNDGKKMDDPWKKIEQPKDYAKEGEKKQREIIKEARDRGDKAIKAAENGISGNEEYNFKFDSDDIVLKRGSSFSGTLFEVLGNLILGDENHAANFDGNETVGTFFRVQRHGVLTLKNGVIANGKNEIAGHAPVEIKNGGKFIMEGGRITANEIREDTQYSLNAGAVIVSSGGRFIMNNGMIDHNIGASGGVLAGDLFGAKGKDIVKNPEDAAIVEMNGGHIISNRTRGLRKLGGGIGVYSGGTLNFKDGIIAKNHAVSDHTAAQPRGGGIFVSDGYIVEYSHGYPNRFSKIADQPYEKYLIENKAEANIDGGLVYKNESDGVGGGFYVDANTAYFNRVMILDNKALTLGGGIYTSYPPRLLELKDLLITENRAEKYAGLNPGEDGAPGSGGGFWSCPYGYIHIADGHTVYVFDNSSVNKGADFTFRQKTYPFELRIGGKSENIEDRFHVYLSPITKDHNFIQFLNDDGTGKLIPENMSYFKEKTFLKTVYNEALKAEAWRNSGAFILGNSASYGGGFGTNANHETPGDEGDVEFHFKKKWDEKIDKSEYENKDIHVDIFIVPLDKDEVYVRSQYGQDPDLYKYGEVVLNQGNNWQASFSKNAFSNYTLTKDNGLPFTKEELKAKGYKYLVMERETDYATSVEETNAEAPVQPGTVHISRDKTTAYGGRYDAGNHNADFYFYELNKDGTLSYIGKSTKTGNGGINAEFSHEILSGNIKDVVPYGKNRKLTEDERLKGWMGYSESADKYSIFVEKTDNGIVLHVPYIWTERWDSGASGIKVVKKDVPPVEKKDFYGYEFTLSNRPFTEAKIKKTWKMLTEEEIRQALGEYGTSVEVKNRAIPDQVTFYILKDGERIVVDYRRDANGKVYPIYKTVTLTKVGGWQGVITKLDPLYLEKNRYGIEEEALEGFKMSYKLKKVLVDPRKDGDDEKDNVKIQFRLSREYAFFSSIGSWIMKQPGYIPQDSNEIINEEPFSKLVGNITVRLIVDGQIREQKVMTWNGSSLDDDKLLFGYDENNPIVVDAGGHHIRVRYYNSMNENWGYHDPGYTGVNLFLKKDDKGIYTLYVPNMLVNGNFAKVFKVTNNVLVGQGKESHYTEITDFNPNPKNLEPYYEYIFEVTNTELPPGKPPHNPPEEPEEPPKTPPETPEEPPVIPPAPPEVPEKPPKTPPVVPPRKPGEPPQTGVGSVVPYMMLALSSSMGLGYIRRKKH
ncbi:LPXTG-motif protein cell wall anchor domain protein [Aedoeadaptatus coxii]|uniref:hypothetical protein n=1 Tax=Aedoeadaptatus coxii TaxID=755172 RepID=UPI0017540297|nr:hypothetical protein [Peptoniphilus coxii]CAC9932589.1 LPXTG-motif protein cell wall anchor domain protein [Peptoniphilus coxii]